MSLDNNGSWSVVCTARAPQDIINKVVEHHLELGASRIFLFFDDPTMAYPYKDQRVKNTICDDDYWKGKRPEGVDDRQRVNLTRSHRWTWTDWTTHIDMDELIHITRGMDVASELAAVPEDVDSVLMPPLEAVYLNEEPGADNAFDTVYFKKALKGINRKSHPLIIDLYGELGKTTKHGLFGHTEGKSFSRVATLKSRPPIHGPKVAEPGRRINHKIEGLCLLHFDAMTFEDFKRKQIRRIEGSAYCRILGGHRDKQMEILSKAYQEQGEEGLKDIYRNMIVFDNERMEKAMNGDFVVKLNR
ncbi:glycosyltransferase family 2 protein [Vreelandella sp. TE19]